MKSWTPPRLHIGEGRRTTGKPPTHAPVVVHRGIGNRVLIDKRGGGQRPLEIRTIRDARPGDSLRFHLPFAAYAQDVRSALKVGTCFRNSSPTPREGRRLAWRRITSSPTSAPPRCSRGSPRRRLPPPWRCRWQGRCGHHTLVPLQTLLDAPVEQELPLVEQADDSLRGRRSRNACRFCETKGRNVRSRVPGGPRPGMFVSHHALVCQVLSLGCTAVRPLRFLG